MTYAKFPESLDADAPLGKKYRLNLALVDGDALTSGTATLVDETSSFPEPAPLIAISGVTPVQQPTKPGNAWGIELKARGLNAGGGKAFVRFEYTTALGNDDHATRWILVEQR